MDEPNSQPTRCPCGFFGSQQTLGLCSKCFREREQNQSQAVADMSRPLTSSNDQSRMTLTGSGDQSRVGSSSSSVSSASDTLTSSYYHQHVSTSTMSMAATANSSDMGYNSSSSTGSLLPKSTATLLNCACTSDASNERRGQKRKHEDLDSVSSEEASPAKRDRGSSSKHCRFCCCRLELAVREIGKCKCGAVFCLLHRLPEQHNCTYDHKEDGRREARAKMVPARKHVGTTLKRLDSDS